MHAQDLGKLFQLLYSGTNLFIHVLELLGFNGRVNLANLTRINPCRHGLICRSPWLAKITSWFCPISILLPNMDTDFLIRFKIWKILTAFDGPSCKKSQFSIYDSSRNLNIFFAKINSYMEIFCLFDLDRKCLPRRATKQNKNCEQNSQMQDS